MIATSYRYIVQRAGVRSGHAIVEGTRTGVHDVVAMTKAGASVDEVVGSFPKQACRGRDVGCPTPPSQIPAGGFPAPGSSSQLALACADGCITGHVSSL